MFRKAGHNMRLLTPITKASISLMGFAFVENLDLVQGSNKINTCREDLIPDFQKFMQRWNGEIIAAGGAICPKETIFINFNWNGTDYEYQTIEDMTANISISDKDGSMITILRKEPLPSSHSVYNSC